MCTASLGISGDEGGVPCTSPSGISGDEGGVTCTAPLSSTDPSPLLPIRETIDHGDIAFAESVDAVAQSALCAFVMKK